MIINSSSLLAPTEALQPSASVGTQASTPASRCCPVCTAEDAQPHRFAAEAWHVVRCDGCGMVYLRNAPEQSALTEQYAWEKTKTQERAHRRQRRGAYFVISDGLKKIKRAIRRGKRKEIRLLNAARPGGGRMLDVGCAGGWTLSAVVASGAWQPFGIEPSPGLAQRADALCRTRGGWVLPTTAVDGLARFEGDFFDAVLMRSYLEHEAHVGEVLRHVRRVLKPGGAAVIKVPNAACWSARLRGAGWPGVRHPDHVNYFTPRHLRRAVADAGFTDVRFPWRWRLPTSDNMWMVAVKT